jgi:nucleoside 2-deoxyribosyltransferase
MHDDLGLSRSFECFRCGRFRTVKNADHLLRAGKELEPIQVAAISCYIRRNPGLEIAPESFPRLVALTVPPVGEKMARFLMLFIKRYPIPGQSVMAPMYAIQGVERLAESGSPQEWAALRPETLQDTAYLGESGLIDSEELRWLLLDCLMPLGFLQSGSVNGHIRVSPLGWQEIARLQEVNRDSRTGFVAMSFERSLLPVYDNGLALGIKAAGYEPLRVDRHEHNNHIDDEIVALIKRSRFLVAEFTGQRGGVYFEAGYAMGLGLPVIWVVRKDQIGDVHFDTRQFNHIVWEADKLTALSAALQFRIERTIGRGPLAPI